MSNLARPLLPLGLLLAVGACAKPPERLIADTDAAIEAARTVSGYAPEAFEGADSAARTARALPVSGFPACVEGRGLDGVAAPWQGVVLALRKVAR